MYSLYTDGGARGNPGPAAIGYVLWKDGKRVEKHNKRIGTATNNIAEYKALIAGLTSIVEKHEPEHTKINVWSDSELMIKQLSWKYKVKSPVLQQLFGQVQELITKLQFKGNKFRFGHIPRENPNIVEADALVNQALDG
jgi:ribonuclease HI